MSGRPAAFLDRDGTIIRDSAYLNDAAQMELLPGAAGAIRRLNAADIPVIVVTNQSGIARGKISTVQYERVERALQAALAAEGAHIAATYMCPHHPDFTGACDCRKPGILLFQQAIADLGIDPTTSAFIGDRWRDVAPGIRLGGHPWLVTSSVTPEAERRQARESGIPEVQTLEQAVSAFLDFVQAR